LIGFHANAAPTPENGGQQPLFGTGEIRSSNISLFPKWNGALARYFDERKLENSSCTSSRFNQCHLAQWKAFLDGLRGKPPMDQIIAVNAYMNHKHYIIDPRNYGSVTTGPRRASSCRTTATAKTMRSPDTCR